MILIILYHYLEVNAVEEPDSDSKTTIKSTAQAGAKVGSPIK